MIPLQKVKDIISKHDNLEKELSSGKITVQIGEEEKEVNFKTVEEVWNVIKKLEK